MGAKIVTGGQGANLWLHASRGPSNLPQSAAAAIFNVDGGRVLVMRMFGTVTTVIASSATKNLKVTLNPDSGTSGDVAANLDIESDEVGTTYVVEGDGTALVGVNAGSGWSAVANPFVVNAGTIDIETSASHTGAIKWDVFYIPVDAGARLNATTVS